MLTIHAHDQIAEFRFDGNRAYILQDAAMTNLKNEALEKITKHKLGKGSKRTRGAGKSS